MFKKGQNDQQSEKGSPVLWLVSGCPPKPHLVMGGAGARVCDAGIKGPLKISPLTGLAEF